MHFCLNQATNVNTINSLRKDMTQKPIKLPIYINLQPLLLLNYLTLLTFYKKILMYKQYKTTMKKLLLIIPLAVLLLSASQPQKKTIFMIGDSTMANKEASKFPETGWGQVLSAFVDTSRAVIDNHARNGRSTKSFINEGLWTTVEQRIMPGDYVFIQFGHNDEKINKAAVYARAETTYKLNLKKFIDETRAKGGIPVLFTSIVRRDFMDNGKLRDTHKEYIDAVKEVAVEMNVPNKSTSTSHPRNIQTMGK